MQLFGPKPYLLVNGLLYLAFGLWCGIDPHSTSQAVGFHLPGKQGFTEFVAVYGGLEFGVGIFFLLCAQRASLFWAGAMFGCCFYLGICTFRTFAIAQVGFDIGAALNFYIAECFFTVWSIIVLKRLAAAAEQR